MKDYCVLEEEYDRSRLSGVIRPSTEVWYYSDTEPEDADEVGICYSIEFGYLVSDQVSELIIPTDEITQADDVYYFGNAGAIAKAYNFANLDDKEIDEVIFREVMKEQDKHPDYHYVVCYGRFPVSVEETGFKHVINSTHLLCVTNYKDLVKENNKSFVKTNKSKWD